MTWRRLWDKTAEVVTSEAVKYLLPLIAPYVLSSVPRVAPYLNARVGVPVWLLLSMSIGIAVLLVFAIRCRRRVRRAEAQAASGGKLSQEITASKTAYERDLAAIKGELDVARQRIKELTPPEKTHVFHAGFCWELTTYFFQQCGHVLAPTSFDSFILGPFCPRCGVSLRKRVQVQEPRSSLSGLIETRQILTLETQCQCSYRAPAQPGIIPIERVLAGVYDEAQRRARNSLGFPSGPCADPSPRANVVVFNPFAFTKSLRGPFGSRYQPTGW